MEVPAVAAIGQAEAPPRVTRSEVEAQPEVAAAQVEARPGVEVAQVVQVAQIEAGGSLAPAAPTQPGRPDAVAWGWMARRPAAMPMAVALEGMALCSRGGWPCA